MSSFVLCKDVHYVERDLAGEYVNKYDSSTDWFNNQVISNFFTLGKLDNFSGCLGASFGIVLERELKLERRLSSPIHVFTIVTLDDIKSLVKNDPDHFLSYLRHRLNSRGFVVKVSYNPDGSSEVFTNFKESDFTVGKIAAICTAQFTNRYRLDFPQVDGDKIHNAAITSGFQVTQLPRAKFVNVDGDRYHTILDQFETASEDLVNGLRRTKSLTEQPHPQVLALIDSNAKNQVLAPVRSQLKVETRTVSEEKPTKKSSSRLCKNITVTALVVAFAVGLALKSTKTVVQDETPEEKGYFW